jgi:hypothetical protein
MQPFGLDFGFRRHARQGALELTIHADESGIRLQQRSRTLRKGRVGGGALAFHELASVCSGDSHIVRAYFTTGEHVINVSDQF